MNAFLFYFTFLCVVCFFGYIYWLCCDFFCTIFFSFHLCTSKVLLFNLLLGFLLNISNGIKSCWVMSFSLLLYFIFTVAYYGAYWSSG